MESNAPPLLVWLWAITWQTALLAAVVCLVTRLCRRAPAGWRHALWLLVVVKFLIPPIVPAPTFATPSVTAMDVTRFVGPKALSSPPAPTSTPAPDAAEVSPPAAAPGFSLRPEEGLAGAWLLGLFAMVVVLLWRVRQQSRLLASAHPVGPAVEAAFAEAAARLGVRRLPRIAATPQAHTPMLVGVLRPTVLLPSAAESSLSEGELMATLLHELAHAKRLDVAALWLYQLVQLAFFFHPALWLAGRQMRKERELACDEMVLSRGGVSREEYASGYVHALKSASLPRARALALAMAEPFELEKRRLDRILNAAIPKPALRWLILLLMICATALLTFCTSRDAGGASALRFHTNDWLTQGLKGRVKTVTSYSAPLRPDGGVGKHELDTKDEFSAAGLLLASTLYGQKGLPLGTTRYTYDGRGLVVATRETVRREQGIIFWGREEFTYTAVSDREVDAHRRPVRGPVRSFQGRHIIYRYRPDGRLTEETSTAEGSGLPLSTRPETTRYRYDDQGRVIEVVNSYERGRVGRRAADVYDADGNLILHTESNVADTEYWDYNLDSHGNWVERKERAANIGPSKPMLLDEPPKVTYRTIEYH